MAQLTGDLVTKRPTRGSDAATQTKRRRGESTGHPALPRESRAATPPYSRPASGAITALTPLAMLPDVVYDLVAACVPTRDRLIVLERVCMAWRRASKAGYGWQHNVDLSWADTDHALASSVGTRLARAHCVQRLSLDTRLFYKWFGEYHAKKLPTAGSATVATGVRAPTPTLTRDATDERAAWVGVAKGEKVPRKWPACRELDLHARSADVKADSTAVSNDVFPAVATLRMWTSAQLKTPIQAASVWIPAWPSLREVTTARGPDDRENVMVMWRLRHLPNLTRLSVAPAHTLIVESVQQPWPSTRYLAVALENARPAVWPPVPLRELRLGRNVDNQAELLAAAGATLHSLYIDNMFAGDAERIGMYCPALRSLEFSLLEDQGPYVLPYVAALTNLEHLSIKCATYSFKPYKLDALQLLHRLCRLQSLDYDPRVCTPADLEELVTYLVANGALTTVNGRPVTRHPVL